MTAVQPLSFFVALSHNPIALELRLPKAASPAMQKKDRPADRTADSRSFLGRRRHTILFVQLQTVEPENRNQETEKRPFQVWPGPGTFVEWSPIGR